MALIEIAHCPKCDRELEKSKFGDYWVCHNDDCKLKYLDAEACFLYRDINWVIEGDE